jgi:hypothetical protein
VEELNAQLVSLVGGNGAQLLGWSSKKQEKYIRP